MINASIPVYQKRLPIFINRVDGVQSYDKDNLYPQRAEEVKRRSYTINAAVTKLSEFISGQGFLNEQFNELPISQKGRQSNYVLNSISQDYATFDGFALHIRYNLNFKINGISKVPFKYCRLSIPNDDGEVEYIKYSDNWERDYNKTNQNKREIFTYPVFNPSNVEKEFTEMGFDHPGQILYFTKEELSYPLATFDPVFDQGQTQSEIGEYELGNIQEGFVGTTVFKYPGQITSEEQENKIKAKLREHKGARGSRIIVAPYDRDNDINLFDSINLQNVDKMFEFTSRNVKNAIRENYQMPAPILGVLPESGMFNQEEITEAFSYFNAVTRPLRNDMSQIFSKIMNHWFVENEYNTEIIPLSYVDNQP